MIERIAFGEYSTLVFFNNVEEFCDNFTVLLSHQMDCYKLHTENNPLEDFSAPFILA